jgi:hypothetical protein
MATILGSGFKIAMAFYISKICRFVNFQEKVQFTDLYEENRIGNCGLIA